VEHLLVTSGRVRAGRLGEERDLAAGQSAQWISDVVHSYAPLGDDLVEAVLVIRSPQAAVAPSHQLDSSWAAGAP
jgi:quercetin dioxygenase-like cupin family protein